MAKKLVLYLFLVTLLQFSTFFQLNVALSPNYYNTTCPLVETIVRDAVTTKFKETFNSVGGVVRLLFHDCFVEGCDASVLITSTPNNTAERDNDFNLSLNDDGFDTIVRAKTAIDSVPQCANKVSCADIIVMATRDLIALAGGPSYSVELGRLDGLVSKSTNVDGNLPPPTFNLDQLTSLFALNGLSQADMIALSACHTIGLGHCSKFKDRLYNNSDPSLNPSYKASLISSCPQSNISDNAVFLDPITPGLFDNQYYINLQNGMGLFSSDQVLYTDGKSKGMVDLLAQSSSSFEKAFVDAITNLGRVGVKTGLAGNIRKNCLAFN